LEGTAVTRGPVIEGPDADGFYVVTFGGDGHNAGYGRMLCRLEGARTARVRIETGRRSSNVNDAIHGGFMLSFLDQALFVGPRTLGLIEVSGAVTLGVSTQFLAAGQPTQPLDCMVEIVRETGRLLFLRGTLEQGDEILLTYQATLRKITRRPT
jgi:acyl-coenzyme A thioesterase PaaI-like protein